MTTDALQWTDSYSNQQDPQQQDRAGAQGHGSIMVPVTVWAVGPVTVITETALQLSIAHVRLVTERLVTACLQNGVCGGKTHMKRMMKS